MCEQQFSQLISIDTMKMKKEDEKTSTITITICLIKNIVMQWDLIYV